MPQLTPNLSKRETIRQQFDFGAILNEIIEFSFFSSHNFPPFYVISTNLLLTRCTVLTPTPSVFAIILMG